MSGAGINAPGVIQGTRGPGNFGGRGGGLPAGARLFFIVMGITALALVGAVAWITWDRFEAEAEAAPVTPRRAASATWERAALPARPDPAPEPVAVVEPPAAVDPEPEPAGAPVRVVHVEAAGVADDDDEEDVDPILGRRLARGWGEMSGAPADITVAQAEGEAGGFGAPGGGNELSARLTAGALPFAVTEARYIPDRSRVLAEGTAIPCRLTTRLVSTQPGAVTCVVASDVWSMDGSMVLIDRGSRIVASYGDFELEIGQERLFITAARVYLPPRPGERGAVMVTINSPMTGPLGEGGVGGHVDHRWGERIGLALLVSLIGDVVQIASGGAEVEGDNNQVSFTNTGEAAAEIGTEIVRETLHIQQILTALHGAEVTIITVGGIIRFDGVYELGLRRP